MFKRRLIAADQASVFMAMMSVHISSGLVLHQMTSDHNRSELIREEATHGIKTTANEAASQRLFQKSTTKLNIYGEGDGIEDLACNGGGVADLGGRYGVCGCIMEVMVVERGRAVVGPIECDI
ncbi:hypothetical protein Tco_1014960, partial [Tanacetum coccineum]